MDWIHNHQINNPHKKMDRLRSKAALMDKLDVMTNYHDIDTISADVARACKVPQTAKMFHDLLGNNAQSKIRSYLVRKAGERGEHRVEQAA